MDLERIHKVDLKIILSDDYQTYEAACDTFNLKKMSQRRSDLSTNFAVKLYKSDRSSDFYTHNYSVVDTRREPNLVVENLSRTKRCYNAPHKFLARLANLIKIRLRLVYETGIGIGC